MASALGRLARLSVLRNARTSPLSAADGPGRTVAPCRTAVCTSSGAILPKPKKIILFHHYHLEESEPLSR